MFPKRPNLGKASFEGFDPKAGGGIASVVPTPFKPLGKRRCSAHPLQRTFPNTQNRGVHLLHDNACSKFTLNERFARGLREASSYEPMLRAHPGSLEFRGGRGLQQAA